MKVPLRRLRPVMSEHFSNPSWRENLWSDRFSNHRAMICGVEIRLENSE
jgi:hypothetical protein